MRETYLKVEGGTLYVRHNSLSKAQTLLFLHGLGDSGSTFEPVFQYDYFKDYNLVVPDLLGYGRSSAAPDNENYSFEGHLQRIRHLVEEWALENLIVAGHSMGGDLGTLLCESDNGRKVRKFVNIEGAVSQYDLFISGKAAEASESGEFDEWFKNFTDNTVYKQFGQVQSGRDYYASLRFCRPEAFKRNAIEIVSRNTSIDGEFKSSIGRKFVSLKIPKVYCYGTRSLPQETLKFLKINGINLMRFQDSGHCPMTDNRDEFYRFLNDFIRN